MTTAMTVPVLRELFRHHQAWHSAYESGEVGDVIGFRSVEISLWDLDYLVTCVDRLPSRQGQAIRLCLLENLREEDAAVTMGVSPTNPVSMYANAGLSKILAWVARGELERFKVEVESS